MFNIKIGIQCQDFKWTGRIILKIWTDLIFSTECWVSTVFNFVCSFSFCIFASRMKFSWDWRLAFNPFCSSCRACKKEKKSDIITTFLQFSLFPAESAKYSPKKSQITLQHFYFLRKATREADFKFYDKDSINTAISSWAISLSSRRKLRFLEHSSRSTSLKTLIRVSLT